MWNYDLFCETVDVYKSIISKSKQKKIKKRKDK